MRGWREEAEVVVVGYGGAGAVTAIAAHDAGAKVVILEKQACDTPTATRHTPSVRMSGGSWFCPVDPEAAARYIEGMALVANETWDEDRRAMFRIFTQYLADNTHWLESVGVQLGGEESISPTVQREGRGIVDRRAYVCDFPELPGGEAACVSFPKRQGAYRHGAALFKDLSDAVAKRKIPIMWETQGEGLVYRQGEVCGVRAAKDGRELMLRASRAVVLTCGGFEFNQSMKENYLRVNPTHFYGNPGNTGEGVTMAMGAGAALWHMNNASWRVTMKFPDVPTAFGTQQHEYASVFVDRRGNRFTNERFKMHAFGYELTNYDCYAMCFPKVPSYWIFDEKRRSKAPLASIHGACNPPGGVMGDVYYIWSPDNSREIERGWIMKADTLGGLARKIAEDRDNRGMMTPSALTATVKRYNSLCRKGEDLDFHKPAEWMQPLEDPPYYAVKLWPGGPNTQGGPKRNEKGQVTGVHGEPVRRLYSAGELGSVWGFLYQAGSNLAECIAFGRIAGANAAAERVRKGR